MPEDPDPNKPVPASLLLVEAFIDGNGVEPDALKHALADPAARDHFVDLLMLRDAVAEMPPVDCGVPTRATAGVRWEWLIAAAALLVGIAGGYLAGERIAIAIPAVEASSIVVQVDGAPPPPAPTDVIVLQPGVNWTDHPGGH